jgi:hypothetical protein
MKLKINKNFTKWSIKKLEIKKLRTNLKKTYILRIGIERKNSKQIIFLKKGPKLKIKNQKNKS